MPEQSLEQRVSVLEKEIAELKGQVSVRPTLSIEEFATELESYRSKAKGLTEEKLQWLKEIGAKEFDRPMMWHVGVNYLFSNEFIKETSLEMLKKRFDERLVIRSDKLDGQEVLYCS